jgi:hypothetical protein
MRTTLNIDSDLLRRISRLTGIKNKTRIIDRALWELLAKLRREKLKEAYGTLEMNHHIEEFSDGESFG